MGTLNSIEHGESEVVGDELLSLGLLACLLPVAGSEIDDARREPVREQAHDFAQVGLGLDVVQVTASDERAEGGVDLSAIVAPDEEPVFSLMESFS